MARAVQWSIVPSASLRPTIPPTSGHTISDLTVSGEYSPAGLFGIVEEKGSIESLSVRGGSEMVWPLPLNCPLKDGMGAQNIPSRERSCCRTTVLPTDTIYINSVSDLLSLAKSCAYDQWSVGKTVVLQQDLPAVCCHPVPAPHCPR